MESTEAGPSTPDLVAGEEGVSGADDRGEHAEAAGSSAVLAFEEPTVVEDLEAGFGYEGGSDGAEHPLAEPEADSPPRRLLHLALGGGLDARATTSTDRSTAAARLDFASCGAPSPPQPAPDHHDARVQRGGRAQVAPSPAPPREVSLPPSSAVSSTRLLQSAYPRWRLPEASDPPTGGGDPIPVLWLPECWCLRWWWCCPPPERSVFVLRAVHGVVARVPCAGRCLAAAERFRRDYWLEFDPGPKFLMGTMCLVTFCIVLVAGASAACGCFIHP